MDVHQLPHLNAALNATCTLFLAAGYAAIRARRVALHRTLMLLAFGTSLLFLVSYVVYHLEVGRVRYEGPGRPFYLALLLTHTVLAAAVPPLAIVTVVRAWRGRLAAHRRLARWTLPIWLYVSVTGVVIYWVLYQS